MRTKVEVNIDYAVIKRDRDVLALLVLIRRAAYNFETEKHPYTALVEGFQRLFKMYQRTEESDENYKNCLNTQLEVLKTKGVLFGSNERLFHMERVNVGPRLGNHEVSELVKNKFIGVLYIRTASSNRHRKMKEDLHNNFMCGKDEYPTDLIRGYQFCTNWKQYKLLTTGDDTGGISFAIDGYGKGKVFDRKKGGKFKGVKKKNCCFICNDENHCANECPLKEEFDMYKKSKPGIGLTTFSEEVMLDEETDESGNIYVKTGYRYLCCIDGINICLEELVDTVSDMPYLIERKDSSSGEFLSSDSNATSLVKYECNDNDGNFADSESSSEDNMSFIILDKSFEDW